MGGKDFYFHFWCSHVSFVLSALKSLYGLHIKPRRKQVFVLRQITLMLFDVAHLFIFKGNVQPFTGLCDYVPVAINVRVPRVPIGFPPPPPVKHES